MIITDSSILITRPKHDGLMHYLHMFSNDIISKAQQEGIDVFDVEGEEAVREEVEQRIQSLNPDFLIFNGHGNNGLIGGHENEILIEEGENEDLLSNSLVYSRVCSSANSLGERVKEDVEAFIGYNGPFWMFNDTRKSAVPNRDKVAEHILVSSNQVPISVINGKTAEEAYERSQRRWEEERAKVKENYDPENQWLLGALKLNKQRQKLVGNPDATL